MKFIMGWSAYMLAMALIIAQATTTHANRPPVCPEMCMPPCVWNNELPNTCPTCACPPTCETKICSAGYECQLVDVTCIDAPCFPQPECIQIQTCSFDVRCRSGCRRRLHLNGCPYCDCSPTPTCATMRCRDGYVCEMQMSWCHIFIWPCHPRPVCVPVANVCRGTPNPRRCRFYFIIRWSYNSVTRRCQRFRYYGCTPSYNTFRTLNACEYRCKKQLICPAVVCEGNCYMVTGKNQCPKCLCRNPCEGFSCRTGYECRLQEVTSDKEPEAICYSSIETGLVATPPPLDPSEKSGDELAPCPELQPPCKLQCASGGLKTDEYGCPLCECLIE